MVTNDMLIRTGPIPFVKIHLPQQKAIPKYESYLGMAFLSVFGLFYDF